MASTYPSPLPLHHRLVQTTIPDISTISSTGWVVPGFRGRIRKVHTVIDGVITGGDAAITVEINGNAVTGAALTIANASSAAGDVDSVEVPHGSTNAFTPTDAIAVISDGGSTNAVSAVVTLELEMT